MPIPEKEFQDEYQRIWARRSELEKVIYELKKHNLSMYFIVVVGAIFGMAGLLVLNSISNHLHKIIELFN